MREWLRTANLLLEREVPVWQCRPTQGQAELPGYGVGVVQELTHELTALQQRELIVLEEAKHEILSVP